MGRRLDDVIAALPEDRRERVEARFEEMKAEVESLGELRRVAGKAQAEIALTLKIKQPSVSKIEKQADMYLSTLKSYVEAVGGQLELIVRLPSRAPLRLERLGDVLGPKPVSPKRTRAIAGRARAKSARAG
ncbi:XRE family transcriptional regulator [Faunimonas sp. B44]|uniref:XRE family transcriptional regulator n=1 Tax=Faunimonas sp. B44 TaxID=3461493 RepID=UPI0040442649